MSKECPLNPWIMPAFGFAVGFTRNYAKILADDLFSPEIMFDALIKGPGADKLFALVAKEIEAAMDKQTGIAGPVVVLAIGTKRYRALKDHVVSLPWKGSRRLCRRRRTMPFA